MNTIVLITSLLIAGSSPDSGSAAQIPMLVNPAMYYSLNDVDGKVIPVVESETEVNKSTEKSVPENKKDSQPKSSSTKTLHPILYKAGTPVRLCWHGIKQVGHTCSETAIKIGKKAEPYMPFMSLCGAIGNIATPFTAHFTNK